MYELIHNPKEVVLFVKDKDGNILWTPFDCMNIKIEMDANALPAVHVEGEVIGNLKKIERLQPMDLAEDEVMQIFAEA